MGSKAWQLGAPGTLVYAAFDALRMRLNRRLVSYMMDCGMDGKDCVVLEAGSGPAFASSMLCSAPGICLSVAMDIDLEALMEARRRDPDLCLVVADLQHLPFRTGSVDLTWNSSTIEHLPSPEKALEEMTRVTRSGGRVFVGVPNLYGPLGFQRLIQETAAGIWIGRTFAERELCDMMTCAGLQPKDSLFYFFRFFVGIMGEKPSE